MSEFMNDLIPPFNTDQSLCDNFGKRFREHAEHAPIFKILEGHVSGVPRLGNIARFESDEEAELVLLRAGFEYVETSKGFRVSPEGPQGVSEELVGHKIAFVGIREDGTPIYRCGMCYKTGVELRKPCH